MDSSIKINGFEFVKVNNYLKIFAGKKCAIKFDLNEMFLPIAYMFIFDNSCDYASGVEVCNKFYNWCFC